MVSGFALRNRAFQLGFCVSIPAVLPRPQFHICGVYDTGCDTRAGVYQKQGCLLLTPHRLPRARAGPS